MNFIKLMVLIGLLDVFAAGAFAMDKYDGSRAPAHLIRLQESQELLLMDLLPEKSRDEMMILPVFMLQLQLAKSVKQFISLH